MGFFKWIVEQPVAAAKFISRQAGTKTGRGLLTTIALTTVAAYGGADAQEYAPKLIAPTLDIVANPGVAGIVNLGALFLMYHRDKPLKDAQQKKDAPKRKTKAKK